jgi:hypothetical protein
LVGSSKRQKINDDDGIFTARRQIDMTVRNRISIEYAFPWSGYEEEGLLVSSKSLPGILYSNSIPNLSFVMTLAFKIVM